LKQANGRELYAVSLIYPVNGMAPVTPYVQRFYIMYYVRTGRLSYDSRQHEITARQGKACDANDLPVMPSSELSLYTAIGGSPQIRGGRNVSLGSARCYLELLL